MSQGDPALMTRSMVTRTWGNAGKYGRKELVGPDKELSLIDDFISLSFLLFFFLLSGSAHPLSDFVTKSGKLKNGTLATLLCG